METSKPTRKKMDEYLIKFMASMIFIFLNDSKDKLVRTVREVGQLGFFDAEQINPQMENVDPNSGTIDVRFDLVESGASQIELQGGYGQGGFIGTLGLFNKFSWKK